MSYESDSMVNTGTGSSNSDVSEAARRRREKIMKNAEKRMNLVSGIQEDRGDSEASSTGKSSSGKSKEKNWEEDWRERALKVENEGRNKKLDSSIVEGLKKAEELYSDAPRRDAANAVNWEEELEKEEKITNETLKKKKKIVQVHLYYTIVVLLTIISAAVYTGLAVDLSTLRFENSIAFQYQKASEAERVLLKARGLVPNDEEELKRGAEIKSDERLPFYFSSIPLNVILIRAFYIIFFKIAFRLDDVSFLLESKQSLLESIQSSIGDNSGSDSMASMFMNAMIPAPLKKAMKYAKHITQIFDDVFIFLFFAVLSSLSMYSATSQEE